MYTPPNLEAVAPENKKLNQNPDVIVVGAGPAGSFAALTAAKLGVKVTVCEEHKSIGLPSHCAGHISINGLKHLGLDLPEKVIENEIKGAVFISPSGYQFRVKLTSPVTYVINRTLLDQHLADLAAEAGADFMYEARVDSPLLEQHFMRGVSLRNGSRLNAKMVIDAEGCASTLMRKIGLQTFDRTLAVNAVQGLVSHAEDIENDMVEVYPTQTYSPGLFAWIIPKKDGSAKVGLATRTGNARESLKNFLQSHPIARRKLKFSDLKNLSYHLIPLGGPTPKTYAGGFLAVGDAASHVKPTTGGGVVMGLTCAKIAGETAHESVQRNDFSEASLARYQQRWKQTIGFDMAVMKRIRLGLNRLSDRELDNIIRLSSQFDLSKSLRKITDIDFQGKALLPLLKSPAAWKIIFYSLFAYAL